MNHIKNCKILPETCYKNNARSFGQSCTFQCDNGYQLKEKSAKMAFCDKDGDWNLNGQYEAFCEREKNSSIQIIIYYHCVHT